MLSSRNTVSMEAAAEITIHRNNGGGWDKGPASMVTWNDWNSSQGGKTSTEHVRGKPDFHQQVQDEPQGQVFADIALGGRLSLVPQGGCTLRAQCPRE